MKLTAKRSLIQTGKDFEKRASTRGQDDARQKATLLTKTERYVGVERKAHVGERVLGTQRVCWGS